MPDWLTHVGLGWLILEALREKRHRLYFLVGCVLPDVEKIYVVAGLITSPRIESLVQAFFEPTHTPIGVLLLSVVSTILFRLGEEGDFARAVGLIFAGAMLHLAVDSLILVEVSKGIRLLWPFTSRGFGINLLSLGDWRPAAIVAPSCLAIALMKRRRNETEDNDGRSQPDEPS